MIDLQNIAHDYHQEAVLRLTSFAAQPGDHWLIQGLSGSGKTTLLHIMAGLLKPTSGKVVLAGQDLSTLSSGALDRFRGRHIGIVFQQLHLLPSLTVLQNVLLAPYLSGAKEAARTAQTLLKRLEMNAASAKFPHQLSHGQRQRVAIARAVIHKPGLILADEPTSSLDSRRSTEVLNLLREQARTCQATLVITSHDQRIRESFDNVLDLDERNTAPGEQR